MGSDPNRVYGVDSAMSGACVSEICPSANISAPDVLCILDTEEEIDTRKLTQRYSS